MRTLKELGITVAFDKEGINLDQSILKGTEKTVELLIEVHAGIVIAVVNSDEVSSEEKIGLVANLVEHTSVQLMHLQMRATIGSLKDLLVEEENESEETE